jgi:group I intron endonuclease
MIGIIYKTTCLINGKIYIGQHTLNNSNYLGSGKKLNNAIKCYGKQNFKRETLRECNTQKELDLFEQIYIKRFDSTNPDIGYNILKGTSYDFGSGNPSKIPEVQEKIKNKIKNRGGLSGSNNPMFGKKWSDLKREQMTKMFKENHPFKNKKHSEKTKQNWSRIRKGKNPFENISLEKRLEINEKLSGSNNPMFGSKFNWINDGVINKRLNLGDELPIGFNFGFLKNENKRR